MSSDGEPGPPPAPDMVWIPGGAFRMGSDNHYPEERPAHVEVVDGFWIDRFPVTNERFRRFVEDTGYVTLAERVPDPRDYPGVPESVLRAGSLVFVKPASPVDLTNYRAWWRYVEGANWRRPAGPGSTIDGLEHHPVVHVAFEDAQAYARWQGKELPTEAEWERAARGGLDGAPFAWGTDFMPDHQYMANTWQGTFPHENQALDGYEGTSPVGAFPPNAFGLYDMIGNVWEWTSDWYSPNHVRASGKRCCTPRRGSGNSDRQPGSLDFGGRFPAKVVKGGSFLCAPNYCRRYRPAARAPEPIDTSACHLGFRCVVRPAVGKRSAEHARGDGPGDRV